MTAVCKGRNGVSGGVSRCADPGIGLSLYLCPAFGSDLDQID
jgi:hypothetical protein